MGALDSPPWARVLPTKMHYLLGMAPPPTAELKLTIALNLCDGGLDLSDLTAELFILLLQAAAFEG